MNAPTPLTVAEAGTHHRTATVVWAALLMGPLVFAIVVRGLVENEASIATVGRMDPGLTLGIWAVMAAAGMAGAFVFRARAAGLTDTVEARRDVAAGRGASPATVLTNLVVAWALAEGQLILAMALYFMSGDLTLWWGALLLHAVGLAAAFPRRTWFTALAGG